MKRFGVARSAAVVFLLVLALLSSPLNAGDEREECAVCGMWIDQYLRTRHVAELEGGASVSFCSIACTAKYLKKSGGEVMRVLAADYVTEELVDAERALYLSGSDLPGVMSYTSRLAFSERRVAESFRERHGGSIIGFREALKELD